MKKIFLAGALLLALVSCQESYELNTDFTVPTELSGPSDLVLDVTSPTPVELSWTGGGAADGGIVLYEVLFDKQGGDFTNPLAVMKSDQGALPTLTLTQAAINTMARNAGIKPEATGTLLWTVRASKGGNVKTCQQVGHLTVTRGEGIDNIPTKLYLYGSAAEAEGQAFRTVEEGVYQIFTQLKDGAIYFKSGTTDDAFAYYIDTTGKLKEGSSTTAANASTGVSRITVDFNTMSMKVDAIGSQVRCIWGATFNNIAVLDYIGNGRFQGEGDIVFIDQSRPDTNPPSWLGWTEERYYFIANVNGGDMCWGRHDSVSPERPVGGEDPSFYSLYEFGWSQWDHLWKMSGSLDYKHATITIETNKDNLFMHTFTNITSI